MNGPYHYAKAEELYEKAREAANEKGDGASAVLYTEAAQFHATMAIAAATACTILGVSAQPMEWNRVLHTAPVKEEISE